VENTRVMLAENLIRSIHCGEQSTPTDMQRTWQQHREAALASLYAAENVPPEHDWRSKATRLGAADA